SSPTMRPAPELLRQIVPLVSLQCSLRVKFWTVDSERLIVAFLPAKGVHLSQRRIFQLCQDSTQHEATSFHNLFRQRYKNPQRAETLQVGRTDNADRHHSYTAPSNHSHKRAAASATIRLNTGTL